MRGAPQAPEGGSTRLALTHEGFDLDSPVARAALEAMKGGWPGVLTRRGALLAGEGGGGRSCDCD